MYDGIMRTLKTHLLGNLWYYPSSVFHLMFLVKGWGCIYDIMIRHRTKQCI